MKFPKYAGLIALAVLPIFAAVPAAASEEGVPNDQTERSSSAGERTLVGAWRTIVTPRNCQSGAPITSFPGLFTIQRGGTMAEYGIPPGASPALRSPGHGIWEREREPGAYSLAFTYYRYDSVGNLVGSQKVTAVVRLAHGGNHFATNSTVQTLDLNDHVIATGCATAAATRFE